MLGCFMLKRGGGSYRPRLFCFGNLMYDISHTYLYFNNKPTNLRNSLDILFIYLLSINPHDSLCKILEKLQPPVNAHAA